MLYSWLIKGVCLIKFNTERVLCMSLGRRYPVLFAVLSNKFAGGSGFNLQVDKACFSMRGFCQCPHAWEHCAWSLKQHETHVEKRVCLYKYFRQFTMGDQGWWELRKFGNHYTGFCFYTFQILSQDFRSQVGLTHNLLTVVQTPKPSCLGAWQEENFLPKV